MILELSINTHKACIHALASRFVTAGTNDTNNLTAHRRQAFHPLKADMATQVTIGAGNQYRTLIIDNGAH